MDETRSIYLTQLPMKKLPFLASDHDEEPGAVIPLVSPTSIASELTTSTACTVATSVLTVVPPGAPSVPEVYRESHKMQQTDVLTADRKRLLRVRCRKPAGRNAP